MPAPERTSATAIVAAARAIVERDGADALTMQAVADRVGVRAPSLYKRVAGRDALLAAVVDATLADLEAAIVAADDSAAAPRARLAVMATVVRRFAHAHPIGYALVFGASTAARPDADALAAAVEPVLDAMRLLVGDADALDAARLLTAWLHGFVTMELAGAFRLGGDVERSFAYGLARILDAVER